MSYAAIVAVLAPGVEGATGLELPNVQPKDTEVPMPELTDEERLIKEEHNFLNPKGSVAIKFCLDNREAILDSHSSLVWTKVFQM